MVRILKLIRKRRMVDEAHFQQLLEAAEEAENRFSDMRELGVVPTHDVVLYHIANLRSALKHFKKRSK